MHQVWVMLAVNILQILGFFVIKIKFDKYKAWLDYHDPKEKYQSVVEKNAKKFFKAEALKNIGNTVVSQCDKK